MKQTIRLTESDIHRIVKESVNRVLKESTNTLFLNASQEIPPTPKQELFDFLRKKGFKLTDQEAKGGSIYGGVSMGTTFSCGNDFYVELIWSDKTKMVRRVNFGIMN